MKKKYLNLLSMACVGIVLASCSSSDDNTDPQPKDSPYINKVYEFKPAYGQFVNELPAYHDGDTEQAMLAKVNKALVGPNTEMISLGGFGGYVVFGFDHMIENKEGLRDFKVLGNAFYSATKASISKGASSEPGIIMVSYDENKNGKPDDKWYEIAGSEYNNKESIRNYEITYYRPEVEDKEVREEYIRWTDSEGNEGWIPKNTYHRQSYFPNWIAKDQKSITFKGTLLPSNAENKGTDENENWVSYPYEYGYADNMPNSSDESAIDINWAVDENGKSVNLPGIHFVKVYTAVHQQAGWLGEISTEVLGAYDLHLKGEVVKTR
ncbi:PKD domain-containing protein [Bacteroides coprosuis]|uniref:PKD domain-containing protein n=1 Tax=Bacteroides coprosuis TaxID=151276 RepID=UPI001D43448D|nr:PKD domain-containing protein [Bacteroides coprosuis]HJD92839.1 PKD domain-containing protein [Bacteroides coprosuis]